MMFRFNLLEISYQHKTYWEVNIGHVCIGERSYAGSSLLGFGRQCTGEWGFDFLWTRWLGKVIGTRLYHRRRARLLKRAVYVESRCTCGHTVHSHSDASYYFMVPCKICDCPTYLPVHPACECGHIGSQHQMVDTDLFLGCVMCDCDTYKPVDILTDIDRLAHEIMEEVGEADG